VKHFRQFVVAATEDEAVDLRKEVGAKALYIAGGTTVVPLASKSVEVLIDISRLGLSYIRVENGSVSIGATTRHSELLKPEIERVLPMLCEAARRSATPLVRNMATIGGSLAGIYLPSDIGVALLALGVEIDLKGDEERVVGIDQILSGGWLSGQDLVRGIRIETLKEGQGGGFSKFGRSDVDIALVNVAAVIGMSDGMKINKLRLSIGQTSSTPVLLTDLMSEAGGSTISHELIQKLADSASDRVKPRSDFRASAAYRKHLIRVLAARSLATAAREAGALLED
jgi:CO/xanthine dehydrogenase FAD-binding subunit